MNIANTLIRLRDDLKDWTTHNILVLQTLIPTKISDLANDENYINEDYIVEKNYITEDYIEEMQLTLGVHTDGLVYLFKNNKPIGNGVQLGNNATQVTNLMSVGEIYLNQRYSQSGGGLVSDAQSVGMFAIIIPFATDGKTTHTLRFSNLKSSLVASNNNTLFLLNADKKSPTNVNGANGFAKMTEGVTISDNGATGEVEFVASTSRNYMVISLVVQSTELTLDDIAGYVITLD